MHNINDYMLVRRTRSTSIGASAHIDEADISDNSRNIEDFSAEHASNDSCTTVVLAEGDYTVKSKERVRKLPLLIRFSDDLRCSMIRHTMSSIVFLTLVHHPS